jgi:hypothetical protein
MVCADSPNKMLKKSASGVLASLRGSTYRSVHLSSLLAAALLDGILSILLGVLLLSQTCGPSKLSRADIVFPKPARLQHGHNFHQP